MSMMQQTILPRKNSFWSRLGRDLVKNKVVYFMWIPVAIYYIIFHYLPMGGLIIAFQNYKPFKGIARSSFVGFKWFVDFLTGPYSWRIIRNTLVISLMSIVLGFPMPILLALMINEVKSNALKKTVQTISYMPHFVSLIVVCGLLYDFSSAQGLFNAIGSFFGAEKINYLSSVSHYRMIYVLSGIWKQMGWGSIIYLATLSAVDPCLYEAAAIDGANRFRRIIHVTLPALVPVITVQLIMRLGQVMGEGYEKTILLYNESTWEVSDIVSSFVYRRGLVEINYSFGAAVGLFNSLVNVIILTIANTVSRAVSSESLW